MRNLIIVLVIISMNVSCKKDDTNSSGIIIKGNISNNTLKSAGLKSSDSLSLSDATKVFVINIDNGHLKSKFIDIVNGSFSETAKIGVTTALVFLDANNKYIGTLSTRGLNLLPLNNLTNGENTIIDLADLTLIGNSIIPSHDPFGNEIVITNEEVERLKEIDGFFESLAKNIDANNDSILDVLQDKQLFIKTRFWVEAGAWGLNNTPPLFSDIDTLTKGYMIELIGDKGFPFPSSINLSGPIGDPYTDISTYFINGDATNGFYSGIQRTGGLFKKGTYNVNIDGNNYTLDYSNIDSKHNQLYVLPTLHTNSEGKLVSVTLEYKLPNGASINPVNIITDVMIQLNDNSGNQYYNSPWLRNENASLEGCSNCINGLFTYTVNSPVDISHLQRITIPYNDLLGNTYFINWIK